MAHPPLGIEIAPTIDPTPPPGAYQPHEPQRLSLPPIVRLPAMTAMSFVTGFGLGMAHGAPMAAYRYRAENAHRLPTSTTGWYLYHKTKNYHAIIGGVKDGMKMGLVIAGSAVLFLGIEDIVDQVRGGTKDVASTLVAGGTVSGLWSLLKTRDIFTASRMIKLGFKWSLAYGLAQDGMAWARGRPPGYIQWMLKREEKT